jgi:hypothetical protein
MSAADMPRSGPLSDWLRDEARKPFEIPRGDVGDQLPLQWLSELMRGDTNDARRLVDAVEALLAEQDPLVVSRILTVAELAEAPPRLRSAVARALPSAGAFWAATPDGSGTLLRAAVQSLAALDRLAEPLPAGALAVLAGVDRPEDGWPLSAAVALAADYAGFRDLLVPTVERAEPSRLALTLLVHGGDELKQDGFERIGREASPAARDRFAAALKEQVHARARVREQLERAGVKLPPADAPDVEWSRYAARLGVPA